MGPILSLKVQIPTARWMVLSRSVPTPYMKRWMQAVLVTCAVLGGITSAAVTAQETNVRDSGSETSESGKSTAVGNFVIKEPAAAETAKPVDVPAGKVTVICSKCNKEVSVDAEYGQKCPHCGIEWALDVEIPTPPKSQDPQTFPPSTVPASIPNDGMSPESPDAPRDAEQSPRNPQGAPAPPGGPIQLDIPPPPPVNGGVQEEMNLANIPLWIKASLFIAALGGLYYVLFYIR